MKIILFDLDGTLIDSTQGIIQSFNYAFDEFGIKRADEKDICALIGHPLEIMFSRLGVEDDKIEQIILKYKEKYRQISLQTTKLLPLAKEAIELASSFARLGVVTTKTARYSKDILEHFGVLKYFDTVIGRENVEFPKPNAQPILKALENIKITPSQKDIFMIGDTCLDMHAAKNAKISSIGLLCGYGTKEDLEQCSVNIKQNALSAVKFLNSNV